MKKIFVFLFFSFLCFLKTKGQVGTNRDYHEKTILDKNKEVHGNAPNMNKAISNDRNIESISSEQETSKKNINENSDNKIIISNKRENYIETEKKT